MFRNVLFEDLGLQFDWPVYLSWSSSSLEVFSIYGNPLQLSIISRQCNWQCCCLNQDFWGCIWILVRFCVLLTRHGEARRPACQAAVSEVRASGGGANDASIQFFSLTFLNNHLRLGSVYKPVSVYQITNITSSLSGKLWFWQCQHSSGVSTS